MQPQTFQPEGGSQHGIDRRRWNPDVRIGGFINHRQAAPTLERADDDHRNKQRRIRVGQAYDDKAGICQKRAEAGPAVPSNLTAQNRMIASKHIHRGDVHDEKSARSRQTVHLGYSGSFVGRLQTIEHVERGHDVEGVARKWSGRDRGSRESTAAELVTETQPDRGQVEAIGATELVEPCGIRPRATPTVQKANVRYTGGSLSKERGDEEPEASKPEMTRLSVGRGAQKVIHVDDCTV